MLRLGSETRSGWGTRGWPQAIRESARYRLIGSLERARGVNESGDEENKKGGGGMTDLRGRGTPAGRRMTTTTAASSWPSCGRMREDTPPRGTDETGPADDNTVLLPLPDEPGAGAIVPFVLTGKTHPTASPSLSVIINQLKRGSPFSQDLESFRD